MNRSKISSSSRTLELLNHQLSLWGFFLCLILRLLLMTCRRSIMKTHPDPSNFGCSISPLEEQSLLPLHDHIFGSDENTLLYNMAKSGATTRRANRKWIVEPIVKHITPSASSSSCSPFWAQEFSTTWLTFAILLLFLQSRMQELSTPSKKNHCFLPFISHSIALQEDRLWQIPPKRRKEDCLAKWSSVLICIGLLS